MTGMAVPETALRAVIDAVKTELQDSHDDLRAAIAGLSVVGLDWRPAPEANSIAALVAHALDAERFLVRTALDRTFERDREAHFRTIGVDAEGLVAIVDEVAVEIDALLDEVTAADLARLVVRRQTRTGAGWLLHTPVHTREHVRQAQLTRDAWLARGAAG